MSDESFLSDCANCCSCLIFVFFRSIRCHAELPNHLMLKFAGSICFSFQRTGVAEVFCIQIRVFNDRGFPHPTLGSPFSLEGSPCFQENRIETKTSSCHKQLLRFTINNRVDDGCRTVAAEKKRVDDIVSRLFVAVFITERRNLLVVIASSSISPSSLLRSGGRQFVAGTRGCGWVPILSIQKLNNKHAGLPPPTT